MIDTNVYLSRWPGRRLPLDEPLDLVEKLTALGVTQAWAGSFDGLLHKDITAVNHRLAEECMTHGEGMLVPFGSVNPMLPDWQEDLQRCDEEHGMPGVRLHPNYHGYALDQPEFAELLDLAGERDLIVQIALKMEDDRTQHPLLVVPTVDATPLPDLLRARPDLQVELLNAMRTLVGQPLAPFAALPNAWIEISMLEGVGGLERLIPDFPYERILFGTYAPFFIPESAVLKFKESELGAEIEGKIQSRNAERLLAIGGRL